MQVRFLPRLPTMKHFVYALLSEKDGRIYVGMTQDIDRRILQHNSGKSKSTKHYVPWKLLYFEVVNTREEARSREIFLKSGVGKEFLKDFRNNIINI